jgi:S1-C subfamily serine protease
VIRSLAKDGPAGRAGIQVRDVILEIDGKPTRDTTVLLSRIAQLAPGSLIKVKVWRDGKPLDVDVTVGKRPRAQVQ